MSQLKKPTIVLPFEVFHDKTKKMIDGVEWVLIDPGRDFRPATGYERMLYVAYREALEAYEDADNHIQYMRRMRE